MAVSDNSGKISGFTITDKELAEKIQEYKAKAADGTIELPCWTNFRSFLGVKQDILEEVVERGYFSEKAKESAYYERAHMLKSMGEWCEDQLTSNPNWGGRNAVKAMFLLKQGLGWTKKYIDEKTQKITGPGKVEINFGAGDPRAKKAAK